MDEITNEAPPENKSINYPVKEPRFAYPSIIISTFRTLVSTEMDCRSKNKLTL